MAAGAILSVCHDVLAAGVVLYVVRFDIRLFVLVFSLMVVLGYPIALRYLVFETRSSNFVDSPAASRELNQVTKRVR